MELLQPGTVEKKLQKEKENGCSWAYQRTDTSQKGEEVREWNGPQSQRGELGRMVARAAVADIIQKRQVGNNLV